MSTRSGRNGGEGLHEGTPLGLGGHTTSYGGTDTVPPPPGRQSPPPYSALPGNSGREYQEIRFNGGFAWTFIFLIAAGSITFYFLPIQIDRYVDAVAQLRAQQAAMRRETKLLVDERRLLEREKLALSGERERWEKARNESRVPQGAFWEVIWPRWECCAYGKRQYRGILRNIPEDRDDVDACINMPVKIKGVTVKQPERCQFIEGSPYIRGFWTVDWDQPDCKPWHRDFRDRGCTNIGSGIRRIEAEVAGINKKGQQDWRVLCETTPMTWNHVTYPSPTHCDERDGGKKIAMWDVPDSRC